MLSMASKEDILMRPILHGLCQYESLKNGVLDLLDIAKMNEALDIKFENEYRLREMSK
jgi:hypothetical protein